jgi:predicted transcriptional regulator
MKKSIRFYLSRNQTKKSKEQDFMTLDRVEDLLSGFKQMLSYLVEDLVQTERENEAYGIMTRNEL